MLKRSFYTFQRDESGQTQSQSQGNQSLRLDNLAFERLMLLDIDYHREEASGENLKN